MKVFIALLTLMVNLFALDIKFNSFEANFTQSITDEKGKTIIYKGNLKSKKPYKAIWHYTFPIEKVVYIIRRDVTVVEYDMEQAIYKKLNEEIDLFTLLNNAKKVKKNIYEVKYNDDSYSLEIIKGIVQKITYVDKFDNTVEIKFTSQKTDVKFKKATFDIVVPDDFDIIQ